MSTDRLATFFQDQPPIVSPDVEIRRFGFQIRLAPWPFPSNLKLEYAEAVYECVLERVASAHLTKSSLKFASPEDLWLAIMFDKPGKEFGLSVTDEVIQIRANEIRLADLVDMSRNVLSPIVDTLCRGDLADAFRLGDRVHTVAFTFSSRLRLGVDTSQGEPQLNHRLLAEALHLDRPIEKQGKRAVENVFAAINAEGFVRLDLHYVGLKTIDDHKYTVYFQLEAPFNENNSILDITTDMRMEDDFELDLDAAIDWDAALALFYRDVVLKAFLANLMCTTEFTWD